MQRVQLLGLYRRILRNAKAFPSVRRDRMVQEIREEFRANAQETDPAKVAQHQETAVRGLSQLQAYTGLQDADANWEVKMEETPLGGLSEEKMEQRIRQRTPQGAVPSSGKDGGGGR